VIRPRTAAFDATAIEASGPAGGFDASGTDIITQT